MRWIEIAWMLRYPSLVLIFITAFPYVAIRKMRSLLGGLLDLRPMQAAAVTVASCVATWSAVLCGWTIWLHGPQRIGVASFDASGVSLWTILGCSCAAPVWIVAWATYYSLSQRVSRAKSLWGRFTVCILGGFVLSGVLVLLCWALYLFMHSELGRPLIEALNQMRMFVAQKMPGILWSLIQNGKILEGYFDNHHRLYAEHLLCVLALLVAMSLYFGFGAAHYFWRRWPFRDVPSLFYVLLLVMWGCWIMCGLTFFMDALRVPAEIVLLVYLWVVTMLRPSDHTYRLMKNAPLPVPSAIEVLNATQSPCVIVAAATGGGIQSSAWTAKVLTQVSARWDAQHTEKQRLFARSLRAISSVSGGSVGAAFVSASYDSQGKLSGADGARAVQAAEESSLAEIAASLAYGDFLNAITPFRWGWFPGRGNALEDSLAARAGDLRDPVTGWAQSVRAGNRPANLFNATLCESGGRLVMGTTALAKSPQACSQFFEMYAESDLAVMTAARLSAAFPFVTPASRSDDLENDKQFHVVDGGYYDNYGIATLADWLLDAAETDGLGAVKKVLLLQLRGFPPDPAVQGEQIRGWFYQLRAPLQTMFAVRSCGQAPSQALTQDLLDTVAIQQLILKERSARDMQEWEVLASCFTEDSMIEMSWFRGSGSKFAAESKKITAGGLLTFHETGPAFIQIARDRAIADTAMAAHVIRVIGGADSDVTFWTRMRSRAERHNGRWLLSGLRVIYLNDLIIPRTPSAIPSIDPDVLVKFRPTYRYLSYVLSMSGHPVANDLPGIDQPETVQALLAAEEEWLNGSE